MADEDTLLRERQRSRSHSPSQLLRDLEKAGGQAMHPPEPEPPPPSAPPPVEGEAEATPLPGTAYMAHSRLDNKPEAMLTLVLKDWSLETFAYGDLRFMKFEPGTEAGQSLVLVLRFIGVAEVRLVGRHLRRLVDPLRRHRLAWMAERPPGRDYVDEEAVAITGITITMVE